MGFHTANLGPNPDFNYQATPLMVDGVLYTTAGSRRNAVALDAATGEMLWVYRLDEGERGASAIRRMSGRGVAYGTDGQGDKRIFLRIHNLQAEEGGSALTGAKGDVKPMQSRAIAYEGHRQVVRLLETRRWFSGVTRQAWCRRDT